MENEAPPPALPASLPPPPMSGALAAAVAGAAPVRTRVPARSFAVIVATAAVIVGALAALIGPRPDHASVAMGWWLPLALAFGAAGPLLFWRAILPPRGAVLPSPAGAAEGAIVAALGLVALAVLFTLMTADSGAVPDSFRAGLWHCGGIALKVIAPLLIVGALVLRRLHPVGAFGIAAAIGAGAGAFAALLLHVICPQGGVAHVALAHAGAAALGAIVGAAVLGPILR